MRISKNQKLFMKKLVKQKDILNLLASSKRDYKKILIENADKKLLEAICESADNLLVGNLPITDEIKAKLKKHRKSLVKLADNTTIEEKKKILNQKGGFINILIPAIISGVASIIASIINKPAVIQPVKEVISEKNKESE
jgi:hypothetical protein